MPAQNSLIVFAKPPIPGTVKTRLIGALTAAQAAALHRACLKDTVALADSVTHCSRFLYLSGTRAQAERLRIELRLLRRWNIAVQRGRDLGERMAAALADAFRGGARRAVLIGTDTPWMGRARIAGAFSSLGKSDVVLGPAEDGGYYLIGAKRLVPKMFRGVRWGGAHVLRITLKRLRESGAKARLLRRDFDLDRPSDLARLRRRARAGNLLARDLCRWLLREESPSESSRRRGRVRPSRTRRPDRA